MIVKRVYKKIQYNKSIVSIEHNLGRLFHELGDLEESLKHYKISKNISAQNRVGYINDILIDICKNYLKLKNTEECETILKNIESSIEENDIDRKIECNLVKYTMLNIDDKYEQAKNILIDTYVLAESSGKLDKAAELAMRVGKHFMDKKEEEKASYYLNQGIKLLDKGKFRKVNG
jgi:tetratricopeptide (TPR) repeat protein